MVVRVNDRGPFLHGRVIDLSYAAAAKLGIAQKGSGEVEVEAILPAAPWECGRDAAAARRRRGDGRRRRGAVSVPVASAEGGFVVQLGAFANYANAQTFVAHLANQIAPVGVEPGVRQVNGLFRVFVGPYPTRDDAKRMADRLRDALGVASTIAVH